MTLTFEHKSQTADSRPPPTTDDDHSLSLYSASEEHNQYCIKPNQRKESVWRDVGNSGCVSLFLLSCVVNERCIALDGLWSPSVCGAFRQAGAQVTSCIAVHSFWETAHGLNKLCFQRRWRLIASQIVCSLCVTRCASIHITASAGTMTVIANIKALDDLQFIPL